MKTASPRRRGADRRRRSYEQVVIEAVQPSLDGGRHPVKVVAGDTLVIEATVFRHGHDRVRAALHWSAPGEDGVRETPMTLINPGLDRWRGELRPEAVGRYRVKVTGWTDFYASWVEELGKRVRAAQPDVVSEIAEGVTLVERAWKASRGGARGEVGGLLELMRQTAQDPPRLLEVASSAEALEMMARLAPRPDQVWHEPELIVVSESRRSLVCIRKRDSCRVSRDHCASERLCGVLRAQQVLDMM